MPTKSLYLSKLQKEVCLYIRISYFHAELACCYIKLVKLHSRFFSIFSRIVPPTFTIGSIAKNFTVSLYEFTFI